MTKKNCLVFEVRDNLLFAENASISLELDTNGSASANEIQEFTNQLNYLGEPVVILLDRSRVFTTTFTPPPRAKSDVIRYALEEQIPLDAEEMCVATAGGKNEQLACVVDRSSMEFVRQLIDAGVNVRAVIPTVIAIAEELLVQDRNCRNAIFAFHRDGMLDLLRIENQVITQWATAGSTQTEFERQMMMQSWQGLPTMLVVDRDESPIELSNVEHKTANLQQTVKKRGAQIVKNNQSTRFDFLSQIVDTSAAYQSSKASQPSVIAVALVLLLITIGGALLFAGQRYETAANQNQSALENLYDQQFSDEQSKTWKRRYGVHASIERKLKKSKAIKTLLKKNVEPEPIVANQLAQFLKDLPSPKKQNGNRYQLVNFEVNRECVMATIQVESAADLDWLRKQMPNWTIESTNVETATAVKGVRRISLKLTRSKS